jgi:hypothetical protein
MIGADYLSRLDRLQEKNRILLIALVIMLAFNLWNWSSLSRAKRENRVALIPLTGGSGLWVGNGKASDDYLRAMARYITGMVGSYTAGTYRAQLQELLPLFPAEVVGQAQKEFMELADDRERFPSIAYRIVWNGNPPLKVVDGSLMQIQALKSELVNGAANKTEPVWFCIHYRIDDTQFRLLSFEELGGQGDDLCMHKASDSRSGRAAGAVADRSR